MDKDNFDLNKHISIFTHKYIGKVRFDEVDMMGITHNLKYFYWLEWARIEYLESIGLKINPGSYLKDHPYVTVHSEIDYYNSSRINDQYIVYTRIKSVKNSSFIFENLITLSDGRLLVMASSVLVNINPVTNETVRIPDSTRKLIQSFEKTPIEFID